jgi:hypothetical protein
LNARIRSSYRDVSREWTPYASARKDRGVFGSGLGAPPMMGGVANVAIGDSLDWLAAGRV